jgi:hypothetical protein
MNQNTARRIPGLFSTVCREMDELAGEEEAAAAREAAGRPSWMPPSPSVAAHRRAAHLLRARARKLERESRAFSAWAATAAR